MQNFQLPHSKLFWYISELQKQNKIDDHEKQKLKEHVIVESVEIFQYLEQYEITKSDETFTQQLIGMVRQKDLGELFGLNFRNQQSEYEFPGRPHQSSGQKSGRSDDLLPPEF